MPRSTLGQITIEKTPNYFDHSKCAKRIYEFNSSIKLILLVRDPAKRVVSEYAHNAAFHRYIFITIGGSGVNVETCPLYQNFMLFGDKMAKQ